MELPSGEVIEVSFSDGQRGHDRRFGRLGDRAISSVRCATISIAPADPDRRRNPIGRSGGDQSAGGPAIVIERSWSRPSSRSASAGRRGHPDARNAGLLQRDRLPEALTDAGLNEDERDELLSMLVEAPTLWRVQADVVDRSGRILSRSVGLMEWSAESRSDAFNQSGPFLTWEEVPVDTYGFERPTVGVPSLPQGSVR